MSTGKARRSQSATLFNISIKQVENPEQPSRKNKTKLEDNISVILVDHVSTSALVDTSETTHTSSMLSPTANYFSLETNPQKTNCIKI